MNSDDSSGDYYEEARAVMRTAERIYNRSEVDNALDYMAAELTEQVADKNPLLLAVLNGGIIPAGLLLPRLDFPLRLDTLAASRYGNNTSGGELSWSKKPKCSLRDQVVVLVDDILDEGHTLTRISDFCREQGAAELITVVLVDKQHERKYQDIKADIIGLPVPDRYVFGCGMDYKGFLRNANGIYAVSEKQ